MLPISVCRLGSSFRPNPVVILIDDLETKRSGEVQQVFDRYRLALNEMLERNQIRRASVHFLVNMLDAYYFADAQAVNQVVGSEIDDYDGDVETIRNPKSKASRHNKIVIIRILCYSQVPWETY